MSCAQGLFPAFSPATLRSRRAFTLIEILSVVVILGIASAIIVPQLGSRDDLRCAAAARALMADLLYAQSRAIATGKMQYVQFGSNTYQLMDAMSPANIITNPVSQIPYTVTVGTGNLTNVTLRTANFDGNVVVAFDPMGVPYSWSSSAGPVALSSGTVVFKAGVNQKTITVGAYSGEIKIN